MKGKRVVIMAGGTGGHVYPALAVANELRARGVEIHWLGNENGFEGQKVPAAGHRFWHFAVAGVRGRSKWQLPFMLLRALWRSRRILKEIKPDLMLAFGGFTGLAGFWRQAPLVVHEQNAVAGLANRWLARWARLVLLGDRRAVAAMEKINGHCLYTGNPVRADISALPEPAERFRDRHGPLRLLVIGGSQGAQALNQLIPEALALIPEGQRPVVRHQVGQRNWAEAQARYGQLGVSGQVLPFIDDMAEAYGWADWIICRAGAATVAEVATVGLAALFVPYPYATDNHQYYNGLSLASSGGAEVIEQKDLSAARLAELIGDKRRPELLRRAELLRRHSHRDALKNIVTALEPLLKP